MGLIKQAAALALIAIWTMASLGNTADLPARVQAVEYDEGKIYSIADQTVVFHVHPSPGYDDRSASIEGSRNLDRILRSHHDRQSKAGLPTQPRLLFVENMLNELDYYIRASEVTGIVHSVLGAHNLTFPNATEFVLSGGCFEACLCQSLRDAIKGTEAERLDFSVKPLNLIFITDAIYHAHWADNVESGADIPYDKRLTSDANLANTMAYLSDAQLLKNLTNQLFSLEKDRICTAPSSNQLSTDKDPKMRNYTVSVYRNGAAIGKIGSGKQQLRADFMTSQEYEVLLNARALQRHAP
jgi:hypothetical protein